MGRVPCGSSTGRGRGGCELRLGDRAGGGEDGEATLVRLTVIVWLSLCVSVWLYERLCGFRGVCVVSL